MFSDRQYGPTYQPPFHVFDDRKTQPLCGAAEWLDASPWTLQVFRAWSAEAGYADAVPVCDVCAECLNLPEVQLALLAGVRT